MSSASCLFSFLRKSIARNFVETVNLIAVKQELEKILEAKKSFLLYVSYILRKNDYDASTFVGSISYRCGMHMRNYFCGGLP